MVYNIQKYWVSRSAKPRLRSWGIRRTDYAIPLYPEKLVLTSRTSGVRLVGIVRSQTLATEFVVLLFVIIGFLNFVVHHPEF
jgi:hypothetical protein